MSFFAQQQQEGARTGGTADRTPLDPGQYGDKSKPGLEIVMYIDSPKASKKLENGSFRHSLLVAAIAPSRESQKVNGNATHPLGDIPAGTAFMKIDLRDEWLHDEPVALAMGEQWVEKAIASGIPKDNFDRAVAYFRQQATDACLAKNTPEDQLEEAVSKQYENILTQIRINVGQVFRLQDWAGKPWDPQMDLHLLAGTRFAGRIAKSSLAGSDGSEVASVYEKGK